MDVNKLEQARDHLIGALAQSLPSDDQIIMGHVQEALDLLRGELRANGISSVRYTKEPA